MKKVPVLQTERITLRGIAEEDTDRIVRWRSDPEIYRYFGSPHKLTKEEHLRWYRESYLSDKNRIDWIGVLHNDAYVGVFGAKRGDDNAKEAEVSYLLSPHCYGKGYAGEAITAILSFCAETWGCAYAVAEIHKENRASLKFAERLGFLPQGTRENEGNFIRYIKELL